MRYDIKNIKELKEIINELCEDDRVVIFTEHHGSYRFRITKDGTFNLEDYED